MSGYKPFGEEWEKEVKKFPKQELVSWLGRTLKENNKMKNGLAAIANGLGEKGPRVIADDLLNKVD